MLTDFLGIEIKGGDTVLYPVRRGSSMWMNRLRVTQVNEGERPSLVGFNDEGRRISVTTIANCVRVTDIVPSAN